MVFGNAVPEHPSRPLAVFYARRPGTPAHVERGGGMEDREARRRRIVENERLLRDINREIEAEAGGASPDEELELLCACGRVDCHERVLVSLAEYEAAHELAHRFVIVPGHALPGIERVVERHDRYWVVEKLPEYQA
jgi:hypothetical protein